jgi:hypothetical protein
VTQVNDTRNSRNALPKDECNKDIRAKIWVLDINTEINIYKKVAEVFFKPNPETVRFTNKTGNLYMT